MANDVISPNTQREIRKLCLDEAIRSSQGHGFKTNDIVDRAKAFEKFVTGNSDE